jgi:hypothetical protein
VANPELKTVSWVERNQSARGLAAKKTQTVASGIVLRGLLHQAHSCYVVATNAPPVFQMNQAGETLNLSQSPTSTFSLGAWRRPAICSILNQLSRQRRHTGQFFGANTGSDIQT